MINLCPRENFLIFFKVFYFMNQTKKIQKKSQILVVDDDVDIRSILIDQLSVCNFNFFEANNGKEALEIISKHEIDLVITDIKMPVMDGITLSTKINELDQFIPVIFVTAFADADNILSALRSGAFEFISKPFQKQFIVNRVNKSLERRKYYLLQNKLVNIVHETLNLHNEASEYKNLSFDDKLDYLEQLITLMSIKLERKNR